MDTPALLPLRVRVLGGLELRSTDGRDLTPPGRKLRALVALLAVAPAAGWQREQLTALLWSDRDEEQARGSLRQALAELRRTLGDGALLTDREMAAFDPAAVQTDVADFTRLAAAGEWEAAAALYGGELLAGVSLPDSGFADWLLVERTRLHDLAVGVLARLLDTQSGVAVIATAQRLLQLDPTREATHRALMRLYAAQGDRSQALRQYQICRDGLQRDLGVKPEQETERLYKEIQSSSKAAPAVAQPVRALVNDAMHVASVLTESRRGARRVRLAATAFVALALAGGTAWWLAPPDSASNAMPVIAVLPFDSIGGDDASRRLADGLTEDVITDLARFPEFRVIARNSTEAYKDLPADVAEVGAALDVGFVVEGSIQRADGRVRITAQLSDTKTRNHLWSERWDRPDGDLFAIQSEISEQIANRMGGGAGLIQEAGRITAHRKPPNSLTAYELYLLGTERLEQITRADVEEAVRLLTHAVELDPGFARAWIELYHSHGLLAGFGVEPERNMELAAAAAERAVLLDPSDAEAHAVFGMSLGDKNDFVRAKAEMDTALRLAPGAAEILTFYIGWASTFGEPERGAELVDEVIRLNPSYPMWNAKPFSYAYFMAGRYDDALRMMDRLTPDNYGRLHWAMHPGALAAVGRIEEAKAWVQKALDARPDLTIEGMANEPSYNEAELQRLIDTMRLAGFPACAKPEFLATMDMPQRLSECLPQP